MKRSRIENALADLLLENHELIADLIKEDAEAASEAAMNADSPREIEENFHAAMQLSLADRITLLGDLLKEEIDAEVDAGMVRLVQVKKNGWCE